MAQRGFTLNKGFVYEVIGDKVLVLSPSSSEVIELSGWHSEITQSFLSGDEHRDFFEPIYKDAFKDLRTIGIVHSEDDIEVSRRFVLKSLSATAMAAVSLLVMPTAAMGSSTGGGGGGGGDSTPPPDPEITMSTTPLETSIVVDGTDPGA